MTNGLACHSLILLSPPPASPTSAPRAPTVRIEQGGATKAAPEASPAWRASRDPTIRIEEQQRSLRSLRPLPDQHLCGLSILCPAAATV